MSRSIAIHLAALLCVSPLIAALHGPTLEPLPAAECAPHTAVAGCRDWTSTQTYPGGSEFETRPRAAVASPHGDALYVLGQIPEPAGTGNADAALLAYDTTTGALRWSDTFDGLAGEWDSAEDLAISPDGTRLFAAMSSVVDVVYDETGRGLYDYGMAVIAYDAATGARMWQMDHAADGSLLGDTITAIHLDAARDKLHVVGTTSGLPDQHDDVIILTIDVASGAVTAIDTIDASMTDTASTSVFDAASGRIYIGATGRTTSGAREAYTHAYDTQTGALAWSATNAASTRPSAIALDPSGTRVVSIADPSASMAVVTLRDTATGDLAWSRSLDIVAYSLYGTGLTFANGGDTIVVAGASGSSPTLVALNRETGDTMWQRSALGPGQLYGVATSSDGRTIFAAGRIAAPVGPASAEALLLAVESDSGDALFSVRSSLAQPYAAFHDVVVDEASQRVFGVGIERASSISWGWRVDAFSTRGPLT